MTEKQLFNRVKTVTVLAVLVVVVLVLWIIIQGITLSTQKTAEAKYLAEIDKLAIQQDGIQAEIDLRNSRTYIEQYARENLGLTSSDEYRYKIEE